MSGIEAWLREHGLGAYERAFAENGIDVDVLADLTEADLASLGVSLGDRKRFARALANAGSQRPPLTSPPPAVVECPGTDTAERRELTVLFCDLVGSTQIAERIDPEALRDLLAAYHQACSAQVSRFGGQVARTFGDGVLAYFGYPMAHEDDPHRAVRAALAIAKEVPSLGVARNETLSVRVGIASGPVIIEEIRERGWNEETASGKTLHLAARIQGIAEPGSVVVDAATRERLGLAMECVELGSFVLKGFARPSALWRVQSTAEAVTRFAASHAGQSLPLVGRAEELRLLLGRWNDVLHGKGHAILIGADPGVGKSRLLHELEERIGLQVVVIGQCLSFGGDLPYHPLIDLLRKFIGVTSDASMQDLQAALARQAVMTGAAQETLPFLVHLLGAPDENVGRLSAQVRQARTVAALIDFIAKAARQRPLVIAIEDLHWIDSTSEAFFTTLSKRIATLPVLMIGTHRPAYRAPWFGAPDVTQVVLSPLGEEDSMRLLQGVVGERLHDPELRALVAEKAQGNPLFLEELGRAIAERGATFEIPPTVQGMLLSRIDGLPRAARHALQISAVLGREFRLQLLEMLWALPERLADLLGDLRRLQLVYERIDLDDTVLVFRHALIQDAAYQTLLHTRRQELHRQAAHAIEKLFPDRLDELASILAHHFVRANDAPNAVKYLITLADRSLAAYALREAESALGEALKQCEQLEARERDSRRLAVVMRLSQTWYLLGRFQESVDILERERPLLEQGQDLSITAPCLFWLAHMLVRLARYDDAETAAKASIAQAESHGDTVTTGKANGVVCFIHCLLGHADAAANAGLRSIQFLQHAGQPYWLGMSEFYQGMVEITRGDATAAIGCADRALQLGNDTEDARLIAYALFLRGWARSMSGDAVAGISDCAAALNRAPDPTSRAYSQGFLAYSYLEQGEIARALPQLEQASEQISRIGFRPFDGLFLAYLSEALRAARQVERAMQVAREGIEAAKRFHYPFGEAWAHRALGRALVAAARIDEGRDEIAIAAGMFESMGSQYESDRCEVQNRSQTSQAG
jgi:class 3 adenylate cyclase/tetratricopeptide (TPR) repeat protein